VRLPVEVLQGNFHRIDIDIQTAAGAFAAVFLFPKKAAVTRRPFFLSTHVFFRNRTPWS